MKIFVVLGSLSAFFGVALGAFGAHGLKTRVAPEVLIGVLVQLMPEATMVRNAGWALLLGTLLFSGSLYLLVLTGIKPLGMITPFGGISFLAGWLMLAAAAWQYHG